jgi:anti-sigma B factor antagonist
MTANSRQANGVTVVDLNGSITSDGGSHVLRSTVKELTAQGKREILLHLGQVSAVDVSGVGELVWVYTSLRHVGGQLKLCNLRREVHDLLQVTKLYSVFDIEYDEASALESFEQKSALL